MSVMGWGVQVVDRPTQGHLFLSRQYVQPQWVLDSANFRVLADAELYAPGKHPPPHLSPFVSYSDDGYVPEYAKAMLKLQVLTPAHLPCILCCSRHMLRVSCTSVFLSAFCDVQTECSTFPSHHHYLDPSCLQHLSRFAQALRCNLLNVPVYVAAGGR